VRGGVVRDPVLPSWHLTLGARSGWTPPCSRRSTRSRGARAGAAPVTRRDRCRCGRAAGILARGVHVLHCPRANGVRNRRPRCVLGRREECALTIERHSIASDVGTGNFLRCGWRRQRARDWPSAFARSASATLAVTSTRAEQRSRGWRRSGFIFRRAAGQDAALRARQVNARAPAPRRSSPRCPARADAAGDEAGVCVCRAELPHARRSAFVLPSLHMKRSKAAFAVFNLDRRQLIVFRR
jgi:hypothetical protein